jgi:hypothetical protein
MQLETIKVKCAVVPGNDQGFYVINKEDFDAEKHELFDAPAEVPKQEETKQEEKPAEETVKPSWQQ